VTPVFELGAQWYRNEERLLFRPYVFCQAQSRYARLARIVSLLAIFRLLLMKCGRGGSTGSKSFGDDFLRVFFSFISAPDARPLVYFSYAEGAIDMPGR